MVIEFTQSELDAGMQELLDIFQTIPNDESIFMNHYQLAAETGKPAEAWKQFLMHPKVSSWIEEELYLFKQYQFKQMLREATDDKRSVGAAQMMNALGKALSESGGKEGPYIIYTHVPPLPDQVEGSDVESQEYSEAMNLMIPRGL